MSTVGNQVVKKEASTWMPWVPIAPGSQAMVHHIASVPPGPRIDTVSNSTSRYRPENSTKTGDVYLGDSGNTVSTAPSSLVTYKSSVESAFNISVALMTSDGPTLTTRSGGATTDITTRADGSTLITRAVDPVCGCPRDTTVQTSHPTLIGFENLESFKANSIIGPDRTDKGYKIQDSTGSPVLSTGDTWSLGELTAIVSPGPVSIPDGMRLLSTSLSDASTPPTFNIVHDTIYSDGEVVRTWREVDGFIAGNPQWALDLGDFRISIEQRTSSKKTMSIDVFIDKLEMVVVVVPMNWSGDDIDKVQYTTALVRSGKIDIDVPVDIGQGDCCGDTITTTDVSTGAGGIDDSPVGDCTCPREVEIILSHPGIMSLDPDAYSRFKNMPFRPNSPSIRQIEPYRTEKGIRISDDGWSFKHVPKHEDNFRLSPVDLSWQLNSVPVYLAPSATTGKIGNVFSTDWSVSIEHDACSLLLAYDYRTGNASIEKSGSQMGKWVPTDSTGSRYVYTIGEMVKAYNGEMVYSGWSPIVTEGVTAQFDTRSRMMIITGNFGNVVATIYDGTPTGDGVAPKKEVLAENVTITIKIPIDIGQLDCCDSPGQIDSSCQCPDEVMVYSTHPTILSFNPESLAAFKQMPFNRVNVGAENRDALHREPYKTKVGFRIADESGVSFRNSTSNQNATPYVSSWQLAPLILEVTPGDIPGIDTSGRNRLRATTGEVLLDHDTMDFPIRKPSGFDQYYEFAQTISDPLTGFDWVPVTGSIIGEGTDKFKFTLNPTTSVVMFDGASRSYYMGWNLRVRYNEISTKRVLILTISLGDIDFIVARPDATPITTTTLGSGVVLTIRIPIDVGQTDCCSDSSGNANDATTRVRSNRRNSISGCAGEIEYVDGVLLPTSKFDNARELVSMVGSDLADPTADEYEDNIVAGNNEKGTTGIQSPPPKQTTPPKGITETPMATNDTPPPTKPAQSVGCMKWDGINYDIQLGKHFSLRNFTIGYPDTSKNRIVGCLYPNKLIDAFGMTKEERLCNLQALAENVLDPLYDRIGSFRINSGIRNENSTRSGISQHCKGQAVDVQVPGWTYDKYWECAQWIKDNLPYDQFIFEHSEATKLAWFHLSFNRAGNRAPSTPLKVATMYRNKYSNGLKKFY